MIDALFVTRAILAAAVALLLCGVFAAWTAANALRRIAASAIALLGAVLGAAALGAPNPLLIAGAAIGFAQLLLGAAVAVRLQESYGDVEAPEINAADARDDAAGPAA